MEFTEYITNQGDRWDTIAYKAYGDASRMLEIADANPKVALATVLPQGTRLNIPISEDIAINKNLLPPWKR